MFPENDYSGPEQDSFVLADHILFEGKLPKTIRDRVLERDRYACRSCNSNFMLSVHHIEFRSSGIDHSAENLVTLCGRCHERIHSRSLVLIVVDGEYFFGGSRRWG